MRETKKANVLVTGAGGFIGGFLCERLVAEGHAVTALAMGNENTESLENLGCRIVRGDLTRPKSISGICRGADLVFHLAARVTYWGTRNDFYRAIVDATRNLLNEAAGNGCRFVFASSVVAVGLGNGHIRGHRETNPTRKTGIFYGDAKLDAENLVWQYHREGKVEGVVIRPTNVIGPGSVWVTDAVENLKKPFFPLVDGGKWSASLLYVENLVDALYLAGIKEAAAGRTYHIMDDYPVTWRQYFSDIAEIMVKPIDWKTFASIPFGAAWQLAGLVGGACALFGIRTTITRHNIAMMGRDNDLDTTRAKADLGWKTRVPYDAAKQRIADWMREQELAGGDA